MVCNNFIPRVASSWFGNRPKDAFGSSEEDTFADWIFAFVPSVRSTQKSVDYLAVACFAKFVIF